MYYILHGVKFEKLKRRWKQVVSSGLGQDVPKPKYPFSRPPTSDHVLGLDLGILAINKLAGRRFTEVAIGLL